MAQILVWKIILQREESPRLRSTISLKWSGKRCEWWPLHQPHFPSNKHQSYKRKHWPFWRVHVVDFWPLLEGDLIYKIQKDLQSLSILQVHVYMLSLLDPILTCVHFMIHECGITKKVTILSEEGHFDFLLLRATLPRATLLFAATVQNDSNEESQHRGAANHNSNPVLSCQMRWN